MMLRQRYACSEPGDEASSELAAFCLLPVDGACRSGVGH